MNNKNDKNNPPSREDLELYAHLYRPDAVKENPETEAKLSKLNRRSFVSMGLAFAFGGAGFYAGRKGSETGAEAYQAKLDEMGGYDGASEACAAIPSGTPEWSECFNKSLRPAWEERHKAAKNYQILGIAFMGASLASIGALITFFRQSNKIQGELMEAHTKDVKSNFQKIKSNDPGFFKDTTPKGPRQ